MATRSLIAKELPNGELKSIYCHWDGYPQWNGRMLFNYYNNEEIIDKILEMGDISSLDESIEKPKGHTFENRIKGYTTFFNRDRGEEGCNAKVTNNIFESANDCWAEYVYVFKPTESKWYYAEVGENNLKELTEEVIKEN